MKRLLITCMLFTPLAVMAAGDEPHLLPMEPDIHNQASLQRGLQTYMNYCMTCHSLKYQRFERTADDLGIPHDLFMANLVFDKNLPIGSLMENSVSTERAKNWFGAAPPDLTLVSRLRGGPDWVYTYLKSFYVDTSRPLGVNNMVFPNVGMPHVLMDLQGTQVRSECLDLPKIAENGGEMRDPLTSTPITEKVCGDEIAARGYDPLTIIPGSGQLSADEYDQLAYDLANFLHYVGDPSRSERENLGVYVLFFLAFFFVFAYLLNREYWKDVH